MLASGAPECRGLNCDHNWKGGGVIHPFLWRVDTDFEHHSVAVFEKISVGGGVDWEDVKYVRSVCRLAGWELTSGASHIK